LGVNFILLEALIGMEEGLLKADNLSGVPLIVIGLLVVDFPLVLNMID
jgi:hypothetical protein